MRTLVYAAGAYALGMGVAEAFAPGSSATGGDLCAGKGLPKTRSMGRLQSMKMLVDPNSVEDPADVVARANSMMGRTSIHSAAASFEASFAAPSAKPAEEAPTALAKNWSPPAGYSPTRTGEKPGGTAAPAEGADAVMARVSEMLAEKGSIASTPAATAVPTAPASKKWEPYGGYNPTKRGPAPAAYAPAPAPAASAPAPAPAKKWEPYGGYDPAKRGPAPAAYAPAPAPASAPAKTWEPYSPLSSAGAPTKRWTAPVGYVPERLKGQQAGGVVDSVKAGFVPASSAPERKWTPPVGYVPQSRGSAPPPSWSQMRDAKILSAKKSKVPIAPIAAAVLAARLPGALRAAEIKKHELVRGLMRKARGVGASGMRSAAASLYSFASLSGRIAKKVRMPSGKKQPAAAGDYLDSLSAAPARKWRAPVGYSPRGSWRRPHVGRRRSEEVVRQLADFGSLAKAGALALQGLSSKAFKPRGAAEKKAEPVEEKSALKKLPIAEMAKVVLAARLPSALYASSFIGCLHQTCANEQVKAKEAYEKRWKPPTGYVPERLKAAQKGDAAAAPAAKKWQPPTGYVPSARQDTQQAPAPVPSAAAPPAYAAAPAASLAYAAPAASADPLSSAPAKKWQPYGGYDPKARRSASGATRLYAAPLAAPVDVADAQADVPAAPAKKWEQYGGYTPSARAQAPAVVDAASAPAKKWEPYGGYEPKTRTPPPAPAKKWEPYGGYEPKTRTPPPAAAAAAAYAPVPANVKSHSSVDSLARPAAAARPASAHVGLMDAQFFKQSEQEASAAKQREEEEEEAAAAAREAEAIYSAKFSPELEAQRQDRLEFYLKLGVERPEAERMVARIVAAYAEAEAN
jgi:hypothetical protein